MAMPALVKGNRLARRRDCFASLTMTDAWTVDFRLATDHC